MRTLALAALVALSAPAQAQLFKCVDAKGRTHYTDKPLADCRTDKATAIAPPPGAAQLPPTKSPAGKTPAHKPVQAAKRVPTAQERARMASDCKVLREQLDWLDGPRGKDVANREARVGQVRAALRGCP